MMRTSSLSNLKKQNKNQQDNRTTKTKASASKPNMFTLSLARNKNNPNPSLFNSVKKQNQDPNFLKLKKQNYQSQTKRNHNFPKKINLFDSLHTKISFDFINSLYSDIGILFGIRIKHQLQNKQNSLKQKNFNVSVKLPSKEQKQCLDKITDLIKLKDKINSAYQKMKNTQSILTYNIKNNLSQQQTQSNFKQQKTFPQIHQNVQNFLNNFQNLNFQLQVLEKQYNQKVSKEQQIKQQQDKQQNESQLDTIIQNLKQKIQFQQNTASRLQKQEKFLISKLYFTQKKNFDLKASSTNLQIKNTNLKDTIRLSLPKKIKQLNESSKTLKRSLSVKLQRIKKYHIQEDKTISQNHKVQNKIIRSRSSSSLPSARFTTKNNLHLQKQTFLDKIY